MSEEKGDFNIVEQRFIESDNPYVACYIKNRIADMARDDKDTTNAALKYLASLSADSSKKTMRNILDWVARDVFTATGLETVDWSQIRNKHLTLVKATLEREGKAMSTVNLYIAAMKGVAGAAFDLGQIDAGVLMRIQRIKCRVPTDQNPGRALEHKDIVRLFNVFTTERERPITVRDEALLGLLFLGGLRMVDAERLEIDDIHLENNGYTIHRKGGKVQHDLGVNPLLQEKLRKWLEVRGKTPGPIICRIWKGDVFKTVYNKKTKREEFPGISKTAYRNIFKTYINLACVGEASPHDARRTFATRLRELGVPVDDIQELLGHSKTDTTMRYFKDKQKRAKRAILEVDLMKRPYHRKEPEDVQPQENSLDSK